MTRLCSGNKADAEISSLRSHVHVIIWEDICPHTILKSFVNFTFMLPPVHPSSIWLTTWPHPPPQHHLYFGAADALNLHDFCSPTWRLDIFIYSAEEIFYLWCSSFIQQRMCLTPAMSHYDWLQSIPEENIKTGVISKCARGRGGRDGGAASPIKTEFNTQRNT